MTVTRFTIDRSKWLRGGSGSMLLNHAGGRCCLGFAGRAGCVDDAMMKNRLTPSSTEFLIWSFADALPWMADEFGPIVAINDDRDLHGPERERRIAVKFAERGVTVDFVDHDNPGMPRDAILSAARMRAVCEGLANARDEARFDEDAFVASSAATLAEMEAKLITGPQMPWKGCPACCDACDGEGQADYCPSHRDALDRLLGAVAHCIDCGADWSLEDGVRLCCGEPTIRARKDTGGLRANRVAEAPDAGDADRARRLRARIHIRATELGLSDVVYRGVLERLTGETSSKALNLAGLAAVAYELQRAEPWLAIGNVPVYCREHGVALIALCESPTCPICGPASNDSATATKPPGVG